MAGKTEVTPQKEEVPEREGPETPPDSPLLDLSDAAIKKLIRTAKKRGYVTHDQINSLSKEVNSEQIEQCSNLQCISHLMSCFAQTRDLNRAQLTSRASPDPKGAAFERE